MINPNNVNRAKTKTQIGLPNLNQDTEEHGKTPGVPDELGKIISIQNSKNIVSNTSIQTEGDVHIGDKIINISQKAEKIINIDKIDNAHFL